MQDAVSEGRRRPDVGSVAAITEHFLIYSVGPASAEFALPTRCGPCRRLFVYFELLRGTSQAFTRRIIERVSCLLRASQFAGYRAGDNPGLPLIPGKVCGIAVVGGAAVTECPARARRQMDGAVRSTRACRRAVCGSSSWCDRHLRAVRRSAVCTIVDCPARVFASPHESRPTLAGLLPAGNVRPISRRV